MRKRSILRFLSVLALTFLVISFYYVVEKYTAKDPEIETEESISERLQEEPVIPHTIKYGMIVDSLTVEQNKVKRNENLSVILSKYNVPTEKINQIISISKQVFNPRSIRAGHNYTFFSEKDSSSTPVCLVYEADQIESIVFKFDSLLVYKDVKDVDTVKRDVGGVIYSSIYETLNDNNSSPLIAIELSKIFATQVDFFNIQKGEKFKIIYDELVLDGKPIGINNIYAASFEQKGKTSYAFNYPQNNKPAFFDESGNSTQKGGFLKAPLKYFRITSRFTKRRFHPVQKVFKPHLGTDYAAPTGTQIIAVADGIIQEARYSTYNGNYVKIKHDNTYATQYLHMSKIASGMRKGKKIHQGQVIGYVGSTGLATGPHVCFRFWKNGKQVDGTKVKVIKKEPIKASEKAGFIKYKDKKMEELEAIKYFEKKESQESENENTEDIFTKN